MKAVLSMLVLVLLSAPIDAAESRAGSPAPTPKPRLRLHPTAAGSVARIEESTTDPAASPLALDRMTVRSSKLPFAPRPLEEENRTTFSVTRGGPIAQKEIGPILIEAGVWRWVDIFGEDAAFKGPPNALKLEFLRFKW